LNTLAEPEKSTSQPILLTITSQSGRSQIKTIHATFLGTAGRGRVEFALGVNVSVDRLLARRHGLGEDGVDITIVGSGLKHRSPVNFASVIGGVPRHNWAFMVLNDRGFYLFIGRTVNTQLLRYISARLRKVRVLLGSRQPGASLMWLTMGERVIRLTTVHPIDRRHGKAQRLLIREPRSA
jgi:hypothetical protein